MPRYECTTCGTVHRDMATQTRPVLSCPACERFELHAPVEGGEA